MIKNKIIVFTIICFVLLANILSITSSASELSTKEEMDNSMDIKNLCADKTIEYIQPPNLEDLGYRPELEIVLSKDTIEVGETVEVDVRYKDGDTYKYIDSDYVILTPNNYNGKSDYIDVWGGRYVKGKQVGSESLFAYVYFGNEQIRAISGITVKQKPNSASTSDGIKLNVGEVYFWEVKYPNNDRADWILSVTSSDYSVVGILNENDFDKCKSSVRIEAKKDGVATITAKSYKTNTIKTCTVTVGNATPTPTPIVDPDSEISVRGISISPNSKTICVGDRFDIHATVTPDNATNKKIVWDSSLPSIATVDENGTVTGIATGYTTIFAETEDGSFFDMCDVVVEDTSPTPTPTPDPTPTPSSDNTTMYRLYNPNSGEHFYTSDVSERNMLSNIGWKDEGVAWNAPSSGNPVYRMYNPNSGDHHYTSSASEKDMLVDTGWNYEGVGFYSPNSGVPMLRLYNPNATGAGSHHYTTSTSEKDQLVSIGWQYEGIAWYGV